MSLTLIITTILTYFLETIGNALIACKTIQYKVKNIFEFSFYIILLTGILSVSEMVIKDANLLYIIQAVVYIIFLSTYLTPLYNFIHDNQMTKALISEPSQEYLILL